MHRLFMTMRSNTCIVASFSVGTLAIILVGLATRPCLAQSYRMVRRSPTSSSTARRTAYRPVYASSQPRSNYSRSARTSPASSRAYRLDDGDTLAVVIDGVLGEFGSSDIPVHMPDSKNGDIQPGMGYPITVRKGAVSLPLIEPVNIRGLTASQAQTKISNAYIREKILKHKNRVMVSLLRKRTVRMTVVHDDVDALNFRSGQQFSGLYQTPRKKVSTVTLPADQASLLDALSAAVVDLDSEQVVRILQKHRQAVRAGDVVNIESPKRGFFYTGGLIPAGQFPIPRDRQLTAMQAMAMAGGSFNSHRGGAYLGPSELVITRQNGQTIRVDANQLRANPNAVRIQPGDALMLQYKTGEVIGNTAVDAVQSGLLFRLGR